MYDCVYAVQNSLRTTVGKVSHEEEFVRKGGFMAFSRRLSGHRYHERQQEGRTVPEDKSLAIHRQSSAGSMEGEPASYEYPESACIHCYLKWILRSRIVFKMV